MRRPRVLVTGDAGFIGGHMVRALAEAGHEVVGWDRVRGIDICDKTLYLTKEPFDTVYHLAAITDARSGNAAEIARVNIRGTIRLLEAFGPRVVFASSSMVNFPANPYAISKRAGEDFARLYGAAIVRLCNIYGPGGHSFWDRAANDDTITVWGDGSQLRTWATVEDAVAAFLRAAPGTTTILPGYTCTIREIAERYRGRKSIVYSNESDDASNFDIAFAPQLPGDLR
jgi:nucleoside-diphosphate-sugar epimerase